MKNIPAIERAAKILELFIGDTHSLTVPEIVKKLNVPRSTAYLTVQTLVNLGYLTTINDKGFTLGLRVFELGNAYAGKKDLVRDGQQIVQQITAETDETSQLAVLDNTDVIYLAKAESSRPLRLVSSVGRRLPAHLTATGKMLLSGLSDDEVIARYKGNGKLIGLTTNSITSLKALLNELTNVRAAGLAHDNAESDEEIRCLSAPVYDFLGNLVAAISISVPIARVTPEREKIWSERVLRGAGELSKSLGYR